ncbi:LOW QUALITY PROTEIN: ras-related GTP-binding protein C-like [Anolis sagrei]|uniref:LOW QUALITY PROTEIN: ras-related GTP-binding protein C-like n=1 Tax=Anolis sagrei TaxID=38937 RepID=UPI003523101E
MGRMRRKVAGQTSGPSPPCFPGEEGGVGVDPEVLAGPRLCCCSRAMAALQFGPGGPSLAGTGGGGGASTSVEETGAAALAGESFPKDFGYGADEEEEEDEDDREAGGVGGGSGSGVTGGGAPEEEDEDGEEEGDVAGGAGIDLGLGSGSGSGAGDASKQPRILLMGLRRSGKSSIQKVVFHKMSPNETLFLESTNKIYKDDVSSSSFVNFQIWDFPGQMDFFDPAFDYEMIFRGTGALIYVIDAQDDYMEALTRLHITVSKAYKINPDMNFEVFIHKVDGLSDDHKIETQRDIHQRANDDLGDAGLEKLHLSFYLTSIYDHSIFEAFSKVVQKLIPQLPTLENLLNIFISNSGIEKAFLFDVVSKIYIATDSSPVDMQSYELCCDMIDVVIDVSCIYRLKEDGSGSDYDKESMAIIRLNNTTVLYLKEVTKFLALVCILREENFERKGLIDYNFHCFRKAIHEVFEVGLSSHRACSHQANIPGLKTVTHNGTPRSAV